jgi:hypothetical protein
MVGRCRWMKNMGGATGCSAADGPALRHLRRKPPYGTPPFAPPHPNTGGAEVPTTPETLPGKARARRLHRPLFNPTNPLGQFGQALVASGGPLGNAMGYMMQQRAALKGRREFANWKQQYDYEVAHPKPSREPHYWESNDGSLHAIGDDGSRKEVYHDPTPKMNFIPDGMGGGQWVAVPAMPSGTPTPVGKITPLDDPAPADHAACWRRILPWTKAGYGAFKGAFIGQESGGRYGVPNRRLRRNGNRPGHAGDGTGPRWALGMPYRPDLMGGKDPTAQAYQNQITDAAAQEAWDAGGGDPAKAAMYYFGGSNRAKWGRKPAATLLTF